MDELEWLQRWYATHCDGAWERKYGLEIRTLDNPGWRMIIDLRDTVAERKELAKVEIERSGEDWLHYWVEKKRFHAAGAPLNLREAIRKFREFVDSPQTAGPPLV